MTPSEIEAILYRHSIVVTDSGVIDVGAAARELAAIVAADREKLREALEPFAAVGGEDWLIDDQDGAIRPIEDEFPGSEVLYGRSRPCLGHFRLAAQVLKETE